MHQVTRFHCDYCRKVLSKKSDMERHEKFCPHNPDSKSCGTCEHFYNKIVRGSGDTPDTAVSVCAVGEFDPARKTDRNPFGMRSNCPFHVVDPYRFN